MKRAHGECEWCESPLVDVYVDDSGVSYAIECSNGDCEGEAGNAQAIESAIWQAVEEVTDLDDLRTILKLALSKMNMKEQPLHTVFFREKWNEML